MSTVKLPNQIKVGPYSYQINSRDMEWFRVHNVHGRVHNSSLVMDIVNEQHPSMVLDTLLHEIYHTIFYVYNIEDEDDEERTICTMATGFTAVLVDNPELVKLINKVTKEHNA
jgi:hypothetical protein